MQGVESVSGGDGEGRRRPAFTCSVRRLSAGIVIVGAAGDLSGQTGSEMYQLVIAELARRPAQLVLELSDAASVDEATVQAVMSASALMGESDVSFCLVASQPNPIIAALAAADLIERFEIYPSVSEAVRES